MVDFVWSDDRAPASYKEIKDLQGQVNLLRAALEAATRRIEELERKYADLHTKENG